MAGDWIKMRTGLQRSPSVVRISSALKADRLRVIGGLHAVWSLADEQTEDGVLEGYTFAAIDEMIGWGGFCAALKAVDWAAEDDRGVTFLRFEKHNGQSAKRRAQEADRKMSARASASKADARPQKVCPREEKRRVTTPIPPSGAFLRFWGAWPRSERKRAQGKCWEIWHRRDFDEISDQVVLHVEAMKPTDSWQRGFIPAPLVYLNQRQWEGAELSEPQRVKVDV